MTSKLMPYLHKHFGYDAGHAIMSLVLGAVALTTPGIHINAIVATGIGIFFNKTATNPGQSDKKNLLFSLIIATSILVSTTIVYLFFPGEVVPAILAGSFSYMVPKEIYDISGHYKFKVHLDNITDALSYQLLSWPILLLFGDHIVRYGFMFNVIPFLALGVAGAWGGLYLLGLTKKLK